MALAVLRRNRRRSYFFMQYKSLSIQENYPLKDLITMKVGGPARYFLKVRQAREVKPGLEFARENNLAVLVLSGGSNLVVSGKGFSGLVMKINIKGFTVIEEDENHVLIKIGAGELWDEVVERAVESGWWGLENMSKIPGRVGAFVVQNAGAYGQECSEVLEGVEVFERQKREIKDLSQEECGFGYRQSIFNSSAKDKYIILNVILKLKKIGEASIKYPDIIKYFADKKIERPSLKQAREAVIYIRENKLPDPDSIPSAGSFFKNLLLSEAQYNVLLEKIELNFDAGIVAKVEKLKDKFSREGEIKVPTGFLIDICGLKGAESGGAKVYEKQALILINEKGEASVDDVMSLFKQVRQTVFAKTGMEIVPEPELVGFSKEELEKYFELN